MFDGGKGGEGSEERAGRAHARRRSSARRPRPEEDEPPEYVREELLLHPVRAAMVETIGERPGINKHQLARAIDVDPGQIDHHMAKLVPHDIVTTCRNPVSKEVHCFVNGDERFWAEGRTRPLFGQSGMRAIALYLAENPGAKTDEIAEALDLTASTIRQHLSTLRDVGLVRRHRAGRTFLYDVSPVMADWARELGDCYERPWRD